MRLLIDARSFATTNSGGVSRVAKALTSAIIERAKDDEVVLATTGAQKPALDTIRHPCGGRDPAQTCRHGLDSRLRGNDTRGCCHCHIKFPNKLWSAACLTGLASFDREIEKRTGKIDAMFLPNIGWVGRTTRPYILLLHDLSFLIEPKWFSTKQRLWHRAVGATRLIKNATHLLAVSETTKRDAIRLLSIPPERITVIPIGATLVRAHGYAPSPATNRYVLSFAGDARKNVESAIAAVELLRQDPEFNDVELVLVGSNKNVIPTGMEGSSNWNSITKISRQARNDISFIQQICNPSDPELADLYTNASCLLYPSWYEGYGLPLHEAAMFGTPCVASSAGALPETAPAGTIFADPAKPHHIAEALCIALTSPRPTPVVPDPTAWDRAAGIILDIIHQYV